MKEDSVKTQEAIGKFLGFQLKDENYAISILKVKEIIGLIAITRVPNMPEWIEGVVNLRGKIIPVEDLNKKFNMGSTESTEETCIIIVEILINEHEVTMGVVVDKVTEVFDLYETNIEENIDFGNSKTEYINSFAKIDEKVVMLLDIDKILSADQHVELKNISEKI